LSTSNEPGETEKLHYEMGPGAEPLIAIRNLRLTFNTREGSVQALNGVDLDIRNGEILGIVGESGCGKTVLGLSMLGLVPVPPGKYSSNSEITFRSENILGLSERKLELIRGSEIAMIFQEPMSSLNPVFKIGDQIAEAVRTRILRKEFGKMRSVSFAESLRGVRGIDEEKVHKEVVSTLKEVRISDPAQASERYPHELSGGMRQRVMIAMVLAARPSLMIADEPTTALDVSIQAQILDLIKILVKDFHISVMFITHDLSVVAEIADRIVVMYAGSIVEESETNALFESPKHPYTQGLLKAQPMLGDKRERLESLKGSVPSLIHLPSGCSFHPRCPFAFGRCSIEMPQLMSINDRGDQRLVACHLYSNVYAQAGMKD
jgi:peptide/nickel transport system ATP-binding protein